MYYKRNQDTGRLKFLFQKVNSGWKIVSLNKSLDSGSIFILGVKSIGRKGNENRRGMWREESCIIITSN